MWARWAAGCGGDRGVSKASVAYQHRHRDKGLCVVCQRPAIPGRVRCAFHLREQAELYRSRYRRDHKKERERLDALRERYAEEGRCIKCGAPMVEEDEGHSTCMNCRQEIHVPNGFTRTWRLIHEDHREAGSE